MLKHKQEAEKGLQEEAQMAYMADYLLQRISMPDEEGNLLQPDLLQPEVQVNPALPVPEGINGSLAQSESSEGGAKGTPDKNKGQQVSS